MAMKHGGRGPGHLSRWTAATSPIPYLFAFGSQGAWFDFTDTSTWYQDAAGTTPAATLGDVVGLVLDKSRGTSFAARRNLLTYTNWTGGTAGTLGAGAVAPTSWAFLFGTGVVSYPAALNGGGTAVRFSGTAQRPVLYFNYTFVAGVTYVQSVYIDAINSGTFQLQALIGLGGVFSGTSAFYVNGILASATDTAVAGTRVSILYTVGVTGGAINLRFGLGVQNVDTGDVTLSAPQFEVGSSATAYQATTTVPVTWLGNHASQATTAQKPLRARIPLGGRRNICVYTETHSGAQLGTAGGTTPPTITGTTYEGLPVESIAFPSGAGAYADSRRQGSASGVSGQWDVALGNTYTCSCFVALSRPLTGSEAITVYNTGSTAGWNIVLNSGTSTPTTLTRRSATQVASGGVAGRVGTFVYASGTLTSPITVYITKMQAELGSSATAYQKVVADWDVTESGVTSIPALYYDGSDDSLATAAIDFATCTSDGAARRNLLTFPSVFDNAAWSLDNGGATNPVVTANAGTSPIGTADADRIVLNKTGGTFSRIQQSGVSTVSSTYVFSVWLKKYTSGTANVGIRIGADGQNCVVTETWQRFSISIVAIATSTAGQILLYDSIPGNDETADILAWGAQLELGSTATAFQDIGTDKMTVFAGVEKLSDASAAMLLELSVSVGANAGTFYITAPEAVSAGNSYALASRGSVLPAAPAKSSVGTAPDTAVLTGLMDISGDSAILRRNGSQVGAITSDQGTGNYGNYPLYLGRRASASVPFKGYMIGHMVIVGKLANASEIAAVEAFERAATGAY